MDSRQRTRLFGGVLILLLGVGLLIFQFVPGVRDSFQIEWSWPMIIIGVGALLLIWGLLGGSPGMAIPACIVGGIGCILYYQNATGDWTSWMVLWTLIPGFVGLGSILAGLLGENTRESLRGGANLVLISAGLFLTIGAATGRVRWLGSYWPLLLVGWGLVILLRTLLRKR